MEKNNFGIFVVCLGTKSFVLGYKARNLSLNKKSP